jgi:hypothetical protein
VWRQRDGLLEGRCGAGRVAAQLQRQAERVVQVGVVRIASNGVLGKSLGRGGVLATDGIEDLLWHGLSCSARRPENPQF